MDVAAITFGPFRLDPAAGRLLRDGVPLLIGNRALLLLQTLAGANGQLVAKTDLIERVWPGQIVEEGNLTVQIAALRKAMGTDSEGRDWIITVPREGYRLIGGNAASPAFPSTPVLPSLAVLPFQNLGGDAEQDYFADGVVEDIITALSRFKSFAVIARNSSFVYKGRAVDVRQVAKDLGVRYVLEGSVRRAGPTLRIAAQLVDGVTGSHLWAQAFDGALEAVFDVQDRITENVAMVVEPRIQAAELERSRRERPGSIAAYDLYLRMLSKRNAEAPTDHADAHALLMQALELEPENAQLLALAASTLSGRIIIDAEPFSAGDTLKCTELAHRGLDLAAGDAVVLTYCGAALIHTAKDYDLGMAAIRSALEANPNNHTVVTFAGIANLHCGSIEEALACLHRAMRLSPRDPQAFYALTGIAHIQMVLGNDTEALVWASRSRALRPNFPCNLWMLIAASARLGRMADAHRYLAELKRIAPGISVARIWAGQPQMDPGRMANILDGLRRAGLPEDADPEPTIPSLAVMPFSNLSGDVEQDYFASGVVEDIITALSRFKSFVVVRQISGGSGARYELTGSVRRAGDRLRINAQLVEGAVGTQLWSQNFDGSTADVFDFQDRITESVASVIEPNIRAAEIDRARRERPQSAAAYDIYLQALAKILAETESGNAEAHRLLTRALELEPNNAVLLANAAWTLEHRITMGWPAIGADDRKECLELSRRGLEHAAGDPQVMVDCGISLIQGCREYDWGMAVVQAAAEANPNNLNILTRAGIAALHCGGIDEALACFHRANRLSPFDAFAHIWLCGTAHCHIILGKYEEALNCASRSLALNTNFDPTYWMLASANAHLGHIGEARHFLAELQRLAPGISIARIMAGQPAKDPSRMAALIEGLRLAGMPEG